MTKLRKGNTPTITKGPYAGEIVMEITIIPRSVTPELDNTLYNLEMMPLTLNQKKEETKSIRIPLILSFSISFLLVFFRSIEPSPADQVLVK